MINVIATLKIAQGKEADFEAAASDLAAKVNANEEGCTHYQLNRSMSDPQTFVFIETYADKAALDAHGKTDYFLAAQAPLGACLAGPPDIQVYMPVT